MQSLFGGPTPYQKKEALRQLSDTFFNAKVDKDLTFINLNIAKQEYCRPLQKISPSSLLELGVFTFCLKSTNLTTQVDSSFLPAVVPPNLFPPNSFPTIWTKLWHLASKLYHLTTNTHLKFFVILISLAKTNLFSL